MEFVNVGWLWMVWPESGKKIAGLFIPAFIPCFIPREITKLGA